MKPPANRYFISNYTVKNLWGHKTYRISFFDDVNVIIGPNASGKTTLINILYDTLSANITRLCRTDFSEVSITLKSFEGKETETVTVAQSPEEIHVIVGKHTIKLPLVLFSQFAEGQPLVDVPPEVLRRRFRADLQPIQEKLRGLVPAVWLPVSRRLPISDEEEASRRSLHRKPLESVDECLSALIEELQRYRFSLNAELSELRKDFQRHALENILYDKQHDRALRHPSQINPPSDDDQKKLLQAFSDVGFVDSHMENRINEHFKVARDAIAKFKSSPNHIDFETLFVIPLIARTRAIVEFAQELEVKRGKLFSALHEYQTIVNSFLDQKDVTVSPRGDLVITPERPQRGHLEWRHLSSGEKQILILLTQALVSSKSPVVYVADEPELSLHVTWQEKLLGSLMKLAGRCQIIVATHSPDIASGFGDKVIDLARL